MSTETKYLCKRAWSDWCVGSRIGENPTYHEHGWKIIESITEGRIKNFVQLEYCMHFFRTDVISPPLHRALSRVGRDISFGRLVFDYNEELPAPQEDNIEITKASMLISKILQADVLCRYSYDMPEHSNEKLRELFELEKQRRPDAYPWALFLAEITCRGAEVLRNELTD